MCGGNRGSRTSIVTRGGQRATSYFTNQGVRLSGGERERSGEMRGISAFFRSPGERVSPHGSDHIELKAAYNSSL